MNQLSNEKRIQVVSALVEGVSINSIVRMTGVGKPTILRLIVALGKACQKFHDERV
jgi:transposase